MKNKAIKTKMNKLQNDATKKVVDGIIDILFRMFDAQADDGEKDFIAFCVNIKHMTTDEFISAPILPKESK